MLTKMLTKTAYGNPGGILFGLCPHQAEKGNKRYQSSPIITPTQSHTSVNGLINRAIDETMKRDEKKDGD